MQPKYQRSKPVRLNKRIDYGDGFIMRRQRRSPPRKTSKPQHQTTKTTPTFVATNQQIPTSIPKKSSLKFLKSYGPISLGAVVIGFVLPNVFYGQWAILCFGVIALIFKVKSKVTFGLALFTILAVPALLIIGRQGLAENFAVYGFLLIILSIVLAARELRFDRK